jgi:hypothetical protein
MTRLVSFQGCFGSLHGNKSDLPGAIRAAHADDFQLHGLTVMSTSFLSSTLLDAGSVVVFIEAHPARNATQSRHAINFLIFIALYLLPSDCQ